MLSQSDRLSLLDRLGTLPEGRRIVLNAVKFSPVRKVASKGGGNVVTCYQSRKMQREIATESRHFEFPVAVGLEHDPEVLEYYAQPDELNFEVTDDHGEIHQIKHTPDFLRIGEDGLTLIEVKSEAKLAGLMKRYPWRYRKDGTTLQWHAPLIAQWLSARGLRYQIITDASIPQARVQNTLFLEDYLKPSAPSCPVEVSSQISAVLAEHPVLTLGKLQELADCRSDDLFKLIADGELVAEIDTRLLSEPYRCRVFRDRAVRAFEEARANVKFKDEQPPMGVLELKPGTRLHYNHQPYTVSLLGHQKLILVADGDSSQKVEVSLDLIEELAANGTLVSSQIAESRSYAPNLSDHTEKELRIALKRQDQQISGDASTVSERTLRRHKSLVEKATAAGLDPLLALVPRIRDRGNRSSRLTSAQEDAIAKVIQEEFLTNRSPYPQACHKALLILCSDLGVQAPSYSTLSNRIKQISQKQVDRARSGKRVAYQNSEFALVLDATTPIHGVRPFESVHMDHTELDIELISSRTGKNLGRPWLSIAVDAFSRRLLGMYLSFDSPSYRSNMMLLRDIVRRHRRLPSMIVVDNGPDFRSENFQLFGRLYGIHIRYRPAGHARHGAVLERLFGTIHTQYIHNLAGNTKKMKQPRNVAGAFLPARLAQWDLEALATGLEEWLSYYEQQPHSTLAMSPVEMYERGMAISGERPHQIVTLNKDFLIMTCPLVDRGGTRMVNRQRGIKLHKIYYFWCPEMATAALHGKLIPVRYDPWDAATVYVQINGRWIGAQCKTLANLGVMTEAERKLLSSEYLARNPTRQHDEPSLQRLKEFQKVFTPAGATALEFERQAENRHLHHRLGMANVRSHSSESLEFASAPSSAPSVNDSAVAPIADNSSGEPETNKQEPQPVAEPPELGQDDLPKFDTF